MKAIAPPQPTLTLRKRRMAIAINYCLYQDFQNFRIGRIRKLED